MHVPLPISRQSIKRQKWNKRIMLIAVMRMIMITTNCYREFLMRKDWHTILVKISVRNCHFRKILPTFIGNQVLTARMGFFSSNSDFKTPLTKNIFESPSCQVSTYAESTWPENISAKQFVCLHAYSIAIPRAVRIVSSKKCNSHYFDLFPRLNKSQNGM